MKRSQNRFFHNRKCSTSVILFSISSLLLIFFLILWRFKPNNSSFPNSKSVSFDPINSSDDADPLFVPELPRFAYFISGTRGDGGRLRRLLQALYHPRNYYLIHLDLDASDSERLDLAKYVKFEAVMREIGNVMVIGKANLVTEKGPTMIASTLHAVAILLKQAKRWDWFINLGASDYPLMPQDDILHIFSYLPRDLNFIEHTSDIGWKEQQRARPIIIDPGLYHYLIQIINSRPPLGPPLPFLSMGSHVSPSVFSQIPLTKWLGCNHISGVRLGF
ncbi:beta-glucuronosyltransferase GlcAT14C-like [Olea europaea var. sylvestris]|uniref:beta-glucuronosyltransferase GlcAT14C-like n=1 Tax=Olea europaea var. sylvestris TaxID=158386 RepID=UPI000C1D7D43|nr:beta-glucuronosyltransferase GlcAT14C-like [Olea europaea var. sylvestris]